MSYGKKSNGKEVIEQINGANCCGGSGMQEEVSPLSFSRERKVSPYYRDRLPSTLLLILEDRCIVIAFNFSTCFSPVFIGCS